ncbi:hypothetical protein [Chryseobacterium daecheongense]|uniref:Uncharacterized protein n=1 Tax=Chryseobacterium daecheongense TaxID=192389 RepID=A0A3N0W583_9FLAO|nr:hypothetical protein [Chryseobacterium daecheongense]ROI00183.1 hypothetical protein EGI05_04670 [Chryseobacterium daecheongense]TDX94863.1 hypothetical protein BCF50_0634 [Chryseobacterium daecheongense]
MKAKFFILFSLFSMLCFSQEKEDKSFFPAEYVLKNSNDTIKAKVRNMGKFTNKKYYFATVIFKMKMKDADGNETWVQPNDVQYIKITDENKIKHEYFASTGRLPTEEGLIEILYEGKNINWYKDYHNAMLDYNLQVRSYLIDKNKKVIYAGFFDRSKGDLKKILKDYPDLLENLKSAKTEGDYLKIIRLYDAKIN